MQIGHYSGVVGVTYSIGNQEGMGLSIHKNKTRPRSPRSAVQVVTCTIGSFQQSLLAETEQEEITPNGNVNSEVLPAEVPLQPSDERSMYHKE